MSVKNEHGLTPQQEKFCLEVAAGNSLADAYRVAYPTCKTWKHESVHNKASALKRNVYVAARIRSLAQKVEREFVVDKARVLQEAARLAFFDIRKLTDSEGNPIPVHQLDADTAAAIQGLELATERGPDRESGPTIVRKYKMADKNTAVERLFKHLGLFKEDNEQSKPVVFQKIELVGVRPKPEQGGS